MQPMTEYDSDSNGEFPSERRRKGEEEEEEGAYLSGLRGGMGTSPVAAVGNDAIVDFKEKYLKYKKAYLKEREVNKELARRNVELMKCKDLNQAVIYALTTIAATIDSIRPSSSSSNNSDGQQQLVNGEERIKAVLEDAMVQAKAIADIYSSGANNNTNNKADQSRTNGSEDNNSRHLIHSSSSGDSGHPTPSSSSSISSLPIIIPSGVRESIILLDDGRGIAGKTRSRRASTLAIQSSLGSGTSLTRKSTEFGGGSGGGDDNPVSGGDLNSAEIEVSLAEEIGEGAGVRNGFDRAPVRSMRSIFSAVGEEEEGATCTESTSNSSSESIISSSTSSTSDEYSINSSTSSSTASNLKTSSSKPKKKKQSNLVQDFTPPLFEHFIVVGPAIETGVEFSSRLAKQAEETSSVSRLLSGVKSILKGIGSDESDKGGSSNVSSDSSTSSGFFSNSSFSFKSINLSMSNNSGSSSGSSGSISSSSSSSSNNNIPATSSAQAVNPSENSNASDSSKVTAESSSSSSSSKYFSMAMSSAKNLFEDKDKNKDKDNSISTSSSNITPEKSKEKQFSFSLFGSPSGDSSSGEDKDKEKEGSTVSNALKYLSGVNSSSRTSLSEILTSPLSTSQSNSPVSSPVNSSSSNNNNHHTDNKSSSNNTATASAGQNGDVLLAMNSSDATGNTSSSPRPVSTEFISSSTIPSSSSTNKNVDNNATTTSSSSSHSSNNNNNTSGSSKTALLSDFNGQTSNTATTVLYRYPPDIDPPPDEVCDFCLPLGGRLRRILGSNVSTPTGGGSSGLGGGASRPTANSTIIQEILYGQGQSKRSGRCFIFTLEDRTLSSSSNTRENNLNADDDKNKIEDEYGIEPGKLYGICVVHPRLLLSTADGPINHHVDPATIVELEAQVCFAFITRFPFFEFFFQVIFDMIHVDRLSRMDRLLASTASSQSGGDGGLSLSISPGAATIDPALLEYDYLPKVILHKVLFRLSSVKVPRFNEEITFQVWPEDKSIAAITRMRERKISAINDDVKLRTSEYEINAAEWSLPALLMWISPNQLMWLIGLMLTETKVIVIGNEPGLVTSAIMGLLSLLRPFTWVMPIIPVLPSKHMDFVESPVPILAGVMIETSANIEKSVEKLIHCCNDAENSTITAVFDISNKEIYMSGYHYDVIPQLLLPGAEALVDRLKIAISDAGVKISSHHFDNNHLNSKSVFSVSPNHKLAAQRSQEVVKEYLVTLNDMARDVKNRLRLKEYYQQQGEGGGVNKIRTDSHDSNSSSTHNRDSISQNMNPNNDDDDNVEDDDKDDSGASGSRRRRSRRSDKLLKLSDFPIDSESTYLDSFLNRFIETQIYAEYCEDNEK